MKEFLGIILLLVLVGCSSNVNKEEHVNEIDNVTIEINENVEEAREVLPEKTSLSETELINIIDSIFELDSIEIRYPEPESVNSYLEYLDSTSVVSFKRYLTFLIIEMNNEASAKDQFDRLLEQGKLLQEDGKYSRKIDKLFRKGGVSYVLVDKRILCRNLRCNMYPLDYIKDTEFKKELCSKSNQCNWLRIRCGWDKVEYEK